MTSNEVAQLMHTVLTVREEKSSQYESIDAIYFNKGNHSGVLPGITN